MIRWTIGDLQDRSFEMLRLSLACAFRLFGPQAAYTVCMNNIAAAEARARTGPLPAALEPLVHWRQVTRADIPEPLQAYFGSSVLAGMGWKLAPPRIALDCYELALDNDCILWDVPEGMRAWLGLGGGALFAQDAERCLGSFESLCPPIPLNAGIRGLAPGVDFVGPLAAALAAAEQLQAGARRLPLKLLDEIEEQGLQAAAICRIEPLYLVTTEEVSICSPFWPRSPELGTCGAHFVGMNARHTPWNYYDRPADDWLAEHWQKHRPALYRKAGLAP